MPMTSRNALKFPIGSLRNQFLIALPGLEDGLFSQSVTYICDHGPEGAMGLVVNRELDLHMSDVFEQLDIHYSADVGATPILAGGPVGTERGFVLHPTGGDWHSSIRISADVSLTASRDIITALAEGSGPEHSQFVLGYAGWGAGQLEAEIKNNLWLTVPADGDILFNTPVDQRWHKTARLLGVDINLMPRNAGHA